MLSHRISQLLKTFGEKVSAGESGDCSIIETIEEMIGREVSVARSNFSRLKQTRSHVIPRSDAFFPPQNVIRSPRHPWCLTRCRFRHAARSIERTSRIGIGCSPRRRRNAISTLTDKSAALLSFPRRPPGCFPLSISLFPLCDPRQSDPGPRLVLGRSLHRPSFM